MKGVVLSKRSSCNDYEDGVKQLEWCRKITTLNQRHCTNEEDVAPVNLLHETRLHAGAWQCPSLTILFPRHCFSARKILSLKEDKTEQCRLVGAMFCLNRTVTISTVSGYSWSIPTSFHSQATRSHYLAGVGNLFF
ncbi:hypothetical protein AHAS_Ahas09G0255900 [Arachis hypogaea]